MFLSFDCIEACSLSLKIAGVIDGGLYNVTILALVEALVTTTAGCSIELFNGIGERSFETSVMMLPHLPDASGLCALKPVEFGRM